MNERHPERGLTPADRVWLVMGDGGDWTIVQLLQHPELADLFTLGGMLRAMRELLTDGHVVGVAGVYRRA